MRVQSLSDAVQELEQHGVRLERASHHAVGGGSALMLRDPEDNLIYLVERPSQFPRSGPSAKVQG